MCAEALFFRRSGAFSQAVRAEEKKKRKRSRDGDMPRKRNKGRRRKLWLVRACMARDANILVFQRVYFFLEMVFAHLRFSSVGDTCTSNSARRKVWWQSTLDFAKHQGRLKGKAHAKWVAKGKGKDGGKDGGGGKGKDKGKVTPDGRALDSQGNLIVSDDDEDMPPAAAYAPTHAAVTVAPAGPVVHDNATHTHLDGGGDMPAAPLPLQIPRNMQGMVAQNIGSFLGINPMYPTFQQISAAAVRPPGMPAMMPPPPQFPPIPGVTAPIPGLTFCPRPPHSSSL